MARARERWTTFWRAPMLRSRPRSGDPRRPVPRRRTRHPCNHRWIAADNPLAAKGFRVALDRLADTIGANPLIGVLKPHLASPPVVTYGDAEGRAGREPPAPRPDRQVATGQPANCLPQAVAERRRTLTSGRKSRIPAEEPSTQRAPNDRTNEEPSMAAPQLSLDLRGQPSAGEVLARVRGQSRDQPD